MPIYLLLAMQAAGMVTDLIGSFNQQRLMKMGFKLQNAGIEANVAQLETEAADESLNSMKNLRQTIGSQIAAFSARGTDVGAGSALSIFTESIGNFNQEEKERRLNVLGKKNQLRAGAAISRLQNNSDISQLWQGFASRTINRFPSSLSGWQQGIKSTKEGFGLTKIGG